jgi:hypothetical protein
MPEQDGTISVWAPPAEASMASAEALMHRVNAEEVAANVNALVSQLAPRMLAQTSASGFRLTEIDLALAVDARGKVGLIAGVEAGVTASIRVVLTRE